jgi:hypothetical protein
MFHFYKTFSAAFAAAAIGVLGGLPTSANAAGTANPPQTKAQQTLELSPTSRIEWSGPVSLELTYTPQLGGFLVSGRAREKERTHWLTGRLLRFQPDTVATEGGVQRYWQETVQLAAASGTQVSKNAGCRALASGRYRCELESRQKNGIQSLDIVVWNRGSDLVHLHLSSQSPTTRQLVSDHVRVELK